MKNLFLILKKLYPDLEPDRDYVLKDDGDGPYILNWKVDIEQPSESELSETWEQIKNNLPASEPSPIEKLQLQQNLMQQAIDDLIFGGMR